MDMSRHLARALVLLVGVGLMAACANGSNSTNSSQKFSGVTVRVLTFTGPQIAEPLQRRAPDFEKATGAKVQIIIVPFSDLYQKLLTDFATKTNSYDATVFDPQWMGDYVPPGYLEDLTDRVKNDSSLDWNDIAPFFRDFSATFKGKVYTIPLDGDFQMVYYRKDLLQKDGLKPACAKACPTESIKFGPITKLHQIARARVEQLHERGERGAYLYGAESAGEYSALNSFFLLLDKPSVYNLPEAPRRPAAHMKTNYLVSFATAVGLAVASALFFARGE